MPLLMRLSQPEWSHLMRLQQGWPILFTGLLLSACSTLSNVTPVGEGPLGAVGLERLVNRGTTAQYNGPLLAFQASHPVYLSPATVARLLTGLQVSGVERQGTTTEPGTYPLFSPEDVQFLSPLVSQALSRAEPNQRVKFLVKDDGLMTEGTLFMHKTTLRVSLSHYRAAPGQAHSRPPSLTLSFDPAQAVVREDTPQSWMIIEPEQPRIAVAVEALNQLAETPTSPVDNRSPVAVEPTVAAPALEPSRLQQELQSTKDLVVKQAEELQRLKAELESVRRQLAEKELPSPKTKPKATPRKPAPQP